MSEIDDRDKKAVPFFARFLEGQNIVEMSEEESEAIGGGSEPVTLKFPSDDEDGGIGVTQKFPSDDEDGGIDVTEKFPSDAEDNPGFRRRRRIRRWLRWRRRRGDGPDNDE